MSFYIVASFIYAYKYPPSLHFFSFLRLFSKICISHLNVELLRIKKKRWQADILQIYRLNFVFLKSHSSDVPVKNSDSSHLSDSPHIWLRLMSVWRTFPPGGCDSLRTGILLPGEASCDFFDTSCLSFLSLLLLLIFCRCFAQFVSFLRSLLSWVKARAVTGRKKNTQRVTTPKIILLHLSASRCQQSDFSSHQHQLSLFIPPWMNISLISKVEVTQPVRAAATTMNPQLKDKYQSKSSKQQLVAWKVPIFTTITVKKPWKQRQAAYSFSWLCRQFFSPSVHRKLY